MKRRTRIGIDVMLAAFVVGLAAYSAFGPSSSPEPVPAPVATFTHVAITLDADGLHVTPSTAAAGEVEVTFTDSRAGKPAPVVLDTVPASLSIAPGTQLVALRELRSYRVEARHDAAVVATAEIAVVPPQLAAPSEPLHQVTLVVRDGGISTPYRETRLDEPIVANGPAVAADVPWTIVAAGSSTVVVKNRSSSSQQCVVDERPARVGTGHRAQFSVQLSPGISHVRCTAGPRVQTFDFWVGD